MKRLLYSLLTLVLLLNLALAQTAKKAGSKPEDKSTSATVQPAAAGPVSGSGSAGQITKWVGVDGSNTFTIGDSAIFEDKFGKGGIGTKAPTSPLTVRGMIETALGGYKFPDGTIQTTAALSGLQFVFTDSTLKGDGTQASPLGVHIPLTLIGNAGNEFLVNIRNVGLSGAGVNVTAGDGDAGNGGIGIEASGGD